MDISPDFLEILSKIAKKIKKMAIFSQTGSFFASKIGMRLLFYFFLLSPFFFWNFEVRAGDQTLILSPGEKIFLTQIENRILRIGDKSLVSMQALGTGISLRARKRGTTRLVSSDKSYRIYILDADLKRQALALNELLKGFKGLSWTLRFDENLDSESKNKTSSLFIIQGELYRFSDWLSLKKAFEKQAFEYEFQASMDQEMKRITQYYLKQELSQPFEILWEDMPFLAVPQGSLLSYYEQKLAPLGLKVREEKAWFFKAPLLELEFAVVESLSSFFLGGGFHQKLNTFRDLLSFLNFLKSSGKGKSLHHSVVLVQSGKSIELESGGQIPFSSFHVKSEQHSTSWKSHGLKISLKPQLDRKNQIFLKIKARLSEPLALNSGGGAVPLKNQTLQTEMLLSAGKIFKIFELKKKSKGLASQTQFQFFNFNFFNGSHNRHQTTQSIFIRINVLNFLEDSKRQGNENLLLSKEGQRLQE